MLSSILRRECLHNAQVIIHIKPRAIVFANNCPWPPKRSQAKIGWPTIDDL